MHVSPEAFSFQQSFKTQRVWWGVCKKALRTCKAFSTVEAEPGENGLPVAAILLQPRGSTALLSLAIEIAHIPLLLLLALLG